MIDVDDIVEALTPIIENNCGCCDVQESMYEFSFKKLTFFKI